MDLRKAPKEIIHQQACEYYKRLCDFFSRGHDKQPPTLVLYDDEIPSDRQVVEVYPNQLSQDKMLTEFVQWINSGRPVYKTSIHAICLNRNKSSTLRFYSDMAEEVTHSVIEPKEPVLSYNKLPHKIPHKTLEILIQRLPKTNKVVILTEFFPALGENHVLHNLSRIKYDPHRWQIFKELEPVIADKKDWQQKEQHLRWWLSELFIYLPQIAGEELVKKHGYDANKVLKEHPDILTSTGIELWQKYCFPQLKNFDFDKIFKE